jgi:hypothetical protein
MGFSQVPVTRPRSETDWLLTDAIARRIVEHDGAWKLAVSDRTEFFNNIDPKLTLECALISLAELIHDLVLLWKPLALPAFPTVNEGGGKHAESCVRQTD